MQDCCLGVIYYITCDTRLLTLADKNSNKLDWIILNL